MRHVIQQTQDIHGEFLENGLQNVITKHIRLLKKGFMEEFGSFIGYDIVSKQEIYHCDGKATTTM